MPMLTSLRTWLPLLMTSSLALGGCTSLLGDFAYDPNPQPPGDGSGISEDLQGLIVVLPTDGLITTEQGKKATFTMKLKEAPLKTVAITLVSSNDAEGKVSPISVTFSPDNYGSPQMIQVTGQDDALPDRNQEYVIRTSPATSEDPKYFGLNPLDPKVTNVDDDTAGFLVTPTSGLVTSESGAEAFFSIVLNHPPTANVSIGLSSDRPTEGTVSPEAVVFTPENWMAPQMVTVTGVDDSEPDKAQTYNIITAAAVSDDADYNSLDPANVEVKNQDNDSAGITLTPPTGLVTFENGAMTTFGIALSSPPTSTVTVGLRSSNEAEGTVNPTSVIFTPENWMAPQVVTVTGVDDDRQDGAQPYQIITDPAVSDDPGYSAFDGPEASVTNIDDDSAGITLSPIPTGGLITSETGAAASFGVKLNTKPSGDVLLDVVSTRMDEGQPTPTQLVFSEVNWAAEQVVTVTGQDDSIADGMQIYMLQLTPNAASADGEYRALNPIDVPFSNTDDDSPGIMVVTPGVLTTMENGGSATFTVALNSQPTADVSIPLASSDTSEGTVSPARLVFTPQNYNAPQTVTIKGVNDSMADGSQPYRIITEAAVSGDSSYNMLNAANVDVINTDDDSPGIIVKPANQELTTNEGGGTVTFTVELQSQPNAEVNIPVSSTDTGEGTVTPANLRFTQDNWNAPQTVTVKGVNDDEADGDQTFRIALARATSTDPNYKDRDALDVVVKNLDNDSPGVLLDPKPPAPLTTRENGAMTTFQVKLRSKPKADVTMALSSSRPGEGTVSPASLTFTTDNWNAPQIVTLKGVDDKVADGTQIYRIIIAATTSDDPLYRNINPDDFTVFNVDDDSPGFTLTPPTGPLMTSEKGAQAMFTIALNSQPTADVTVALHSTRPAEGTVSPASVTFTSMNWAGQKMITVTGANDAMQDGAQPYSIIIDQATSADTKYAGIDPPDMTATNIDDDTAGISVTKATPNLVTTEKGGTASFTISLNSQPKNDVTIPVVSSNEGEGVISPTSVTFTTLNWNGEQKVTITGANDSIADGAQPYTIELLPAESADTNYKDMDAPDVAVTNTDDDSAGITVTDPPGNTNEKGLKTKFTVVLNSQPTGPVTIPISSGNTAEGTVNKASLTFSTTDWLSPQEVEITGVNDDFADGPQSYGIELGLATSTDAKYRIDPRDVTLLNEDDDSAGITLTARSGTTREPGDSFTFRVSLNSKPTADVTIPLSSSDETEGTVSPASLTFSTTTWNSTQLVTVTAVNDDMADGDQSYLAMLGAAVSQDSDYSGMNSPDVVMLNEDKDSVGIIVSPLTGSTTEGGTPFKFNVRLNSQPTATVTIPLQSSDTTEGTVTPTMLVFTTDDWGSNHEVTVHGEEDRVADGAVPYVIRTLAAVSTDTNYNARNADDVSLTNTDNDTVGVTVSAASNNTKEPGTTATFKVVLNSQPTANVSIPISSDDPTEGNVAVGSIEFTTTDWMLEQTITVQGVDDDVEDLDQTYHIILGNPETADEKYAAYNPADVTLINEDDDTAGVDVTPSMLSVFEQGVMTSFDIKLNSQPTANVVIPLSVTDSSEISLQVDSVTITPSGWKTATKVYVLPVDDKAADDQQTSKVVTGPMTSTDAKYAGVNPADVNVTIGDNDMASIQVSNPSGLQTSEDPTNAGVTVSVVLSSAPSSSVTIPVVSLNLAEGEVILDGPGGNELVFTAANYDVPRIVTIKGVQDDGTVDGSQVFSVQFGPSVSADADYGDESLPTFDITNLDDDTP